MQEVLTAQDQRDEGPRAAAARFILRPSVQGAIMALIVLNAITLGLETSGRAMAAFGDVLMALDRLFLWIFTIEILARIYAFRGRFFRDPWGIFDLLVIAIAWLPATGPLSVLRALRVLRVLRLISMMPRLRIVVEAMLHAVPGIGAIALLMVILYYVAAVIATKLFADTHPQFFGTIGESMYTLFQIMTLESWSMGIVRPVMEASPQAWLFFIPFILIATFVMLNLFIGVIIESIQTLRKQREEAEALPGLDPAVVMRELRALREEVAALRTTVGPR
ncbi:ion transporter [Elioraea sp. Yellowstone]|jgi:voltage-gated sodium channel|uniref:ion transporter n=1 Tax=Elioraea sp. Yellowstone TaxID=2592070 RepID=UPI0011544640|nr:ion transporter [Elioraea sp. Yellowstone]TQF76542.1 ion transporter [Elioraea sp. Yellowstone]